jgi:hypothetical protein
MGQPLPGASVVIVGTRRGTTTDAEGYYVILTVEPGIYSLTASMVGYNNQTKTDVDVRADFTSEVNFKLTETAIEAAEIVVTVERPLVEVDKTSSKYVVGEAEIAEVPIVRTASEVVALQPGADVGGEESVRSSEIGTSGSRGDGNDIIYYVDGVQVSHSTQAGYQRGVGRQIFAGLSKTAAQEIALVTGGMEAEYGNAQGGVISVVTREGAPDYHAWGEYRYTPAGKKHWGANVYEAPIHKDKMKWGNAAWENETYAAVGPDGVLGTEDDVQGLAHERIDYTEVGGHAFDVNVSGPLTDNSSFMVAADISRLASPLPAPLKSGFELPNGALIPSVGYTNMSYNGTFRPSQNLKLKVGGMFRRFSRYVEQDVSYWVSGGIVKGLGDSGRNIFLPMEWSGSGKNRNTDHTEYVTLTHTLSPRTFYEVRIARSSSMQDTSQVPGGQKATLDPQRDRDGWFTVYRHVRQFEQKSRTSWQLKADFSSQVTRGHFVKAGLDLVKHSIWTTRVTRDTAVRRRLELSGKNGVFLGQPAGPIIGALYLQDKMEFEGLIINAGVRFDWLDPWDHVPFLPHAAKMPMYLTYTRFQNVPLKDQPPRFKLSPRLGVSHPITDRSTVHFFIGQFAQWPSLYYLYNQDWLTSSQDQDWDNNGVIDASEFFNTGIVSYPVRGGQGSSKFKVEKNVSFEVGVDWNFVSDFVLASSIFYKSQSNQYRRPGSSTLQGDKRRWVRRYILSLGNQHFEDIRGLEMSLKKRFSGNFSFRVAYNLRWFTDGRNGNYRNDIVPDSIWISTPYADGTPRYWSDFKVEGGREVPVYLAEEELAGAGSYLNRYLQNHRNNRNQSISGRYYYGTLAPMKEWGYTGFDDIDENHLWMMPRAYSGGISPRSDVRNSGSAQFLYATSPDYGPNVRLFGSPVFANWRVNLIYRIYTGSNFNYNPPTGRREVRHRAIRTWTDMHVEKSFPFARGEFSLYLEAFNVFNQKDSVSSGFDYIQWGLQAPRPNDPDYLKYGDLSDRSRYYGNPREMVFGIRANF